MKFGWNVLKRQTEPDFRFVVTLSRWQPWRLFMQQSIDLWWVLMKRLHGAYVATSGSSWSIVHSMSFLLIMWESYVNTFIAFFMYLHESFSMSWCDRIGCFSSSSTTMPGPCVQAPPTNSMMRAPVFGYVHYTADHHVHTYTLHR